MAITTILLDLDGTLLTMDNDEFTKGYFKLIAKRLAPYGYEAKQLVDSIWAGTKAMVTNDGTRMNDVAFWDAFCAIYGEKARVDEAIFQSFYENEFDQAIAFCAKNDGARKVLDLIHELGFTAVLATNPIFPAIATEKRMRWAGLAPEDFALFTTYENIGYGKPNPEYYREITRMLKIDPSECLMVGNDVDEDILAAGSVGMKTFLLTDNVINRKDTDISDVSKGGFEELLEYLKNLK